MRREDPDLATYDEMELYAIITTRQNRNLKMILFLVCCALVGCIIIGVAEYVALH